MDQSIDLSTYCWPYFQILAHNENVAISFASLTPDNAPSALTLLVQWWQKDWNDDLVQRFFGWRYLARPFGETLLVLDNGRCVAILDAFLRQYLISGRYVTVRETCDWFCQPEYRPLGLGIKLMRQMMSRPEPIIVVGGTEATRTLLPKLKFQRLPDVPSYLLPVSCRMLAAFGLPYFVAGSEVIAKLIPSHLKLRRPRRLPPPAPSVQVCVSSDGKIPLPPPDAYALASLIDKDSLEWLTLAPSEIGRFITLNFLVDGELVGISTSRLVRSAEGHAANLLHLQSTVYSAAMIGWIVSETARHLVACGAGFITCRSSCPMISAALRRVGFLSVRHLPAFWWSSAGMTPAGAMHLTMNRGDDGLGRF